MKAYVYTEYGPVDNLTLVDTAVPVPRENEVLVRVRAVSINDWDWQLLQGTPIVNRMINGFFRPKRQILGGDAAGIVEAVGENASRFQPGDNVYGDLSGRWGSFAEYVAAKETAVVPMPSIPFEQAAAVPHAAVLAMQGLLDHGDMQPKQKLLINGAGGGVGTFGLQLAKLKGLEVHGVDTGDKSAMMRAMGFDEVFDYTQSDFTEGDRRYDLILDTKTNRPPARYLRVLTPGGKYITVGGDNRHLLWAFLSSKRSHAQNKKIGVVALQQNKHLDYLHPLLEVGHIKSVIDGPYPFEKLPQAMQHFGDGRHKGKVVVTIGTC